MRDKGLAVGLSSVLSLYALPLRLRQILSGRHRIVAIFYGGAVFHAARRRIYILSVRKCSVASIATVSMDEIPPHRIGSETRLESTIRCSAITSHQRKQIGARTVYTNTSADLRFRDSGNAQR